MVAATSSSVRLAGMLTTALAWRSLTHLTGPLSVNTAQALLKIAAGAASALLGVLLVRSGIISGLTVNSSGADGCARVRPFAAGADPGRRQRSEKARRRVAEAPSLRPSRALRTRRPRLSGPRAELDDHPVAAPSFWAAHLRPRRDLSRATDALHGMTSSSPPGSVAQPSRSIGALFLIAW